MEIFNKDNSDIEESFNIHTDLALENREKFAGQNVEIPGVKLEEEDVYSDVRLTKVQIVTDEGASIMGKPKGNYITIEVYNMNEGYPPQGMKNVAEILAKELRRMLPVKNAQDIEKLSVLVVGLGNRDVTPDALGPYVISNLEVNRHIYMLQKKPVTGKGVSAMIPGVMAQSGMESAEMVKGIVKQIKPDVVIAIDALAARNTRRLNRTIQIADTGIHPGSGIGNHRMGLNQETLGVPVIAIGIPTVIDAATIVSDTIDAMIKAFESASKQEKGSLTNVFSEFTPAQKIQLIRELLEPQLGTMFVTPKDIDENIKCMAETVACGINAVFAV